MVWCLSPVDPLSGEHQYYIFSKGTYKVGRKGCDIIITKDKGGSRIHAEMIIDEMICMGSLQKRYTHHSSKVRIRDCSKYGSFLNRNLGSKEKVPELPNRETALNDGDLVSFGTGNATYRFHFLPLVLFPCQLNPSVVNQLREKASLIGASVSPTWTAQCTHLVIDDFTSVNDETIDAITSNKALVKVSWIEEIVGKSVCAEIPSTVSHGPTLNLDGVSVKVTDPQHREQCLKGYTFLLESVDKYKFVEKLPLLLDECDSKVVCVDAVEPNSQDFGDHLVCVIPAQSTSRTEYFHKFNHLPKLKEMELISAMFSGHVDPSIMESAPVIVSSSCSTDETVVADSDLETETATSIPKSVVDNLVESAEDKHESKIEIREAELSINNWKTQNIVEITESMEHDGGLSMAAGINIEHESQEVLPRNHDTINHDSSYTTAVKSDTIHTALLKDEKHFAMERKDTSHVSESANVDIIYSQNLIVRDSCLPHNNSHSSMSGGAINFKRFRKANAPLGNSFNNLVPFSKYPYDSTYYENEDMAESVKEEKRRKQMEAIADDLFNTEKSGEEAWPSWSSSWTFSSWLMRNRMCVCVRALM